MRGYDHAALLADALGGDQRPAGDAGAAAGRLAPGRVSAAAAARGAWPRAPSRCAPPRPVPRVCVLVDDVHTTGATLAACAAALRSAGASEVRAITYAREL